jgi:hypothetical protein
MQTKPSFDDDHITSVASMLYLEKPIRDVDIAVLFEIATFPATQRAINSASVRHSLFI